MSINGKGRPRTPAFAVGTRFKHFTLVDTATRKDVSGYDVEFYVCRCDCGKEWEKSKSSLRTHPDTMCMACAGKANAIKRSVGKEKVPAVKRVWQGMLDRCTKPTHQAYKNYGGRGITVCQRWHKFENFFADMGECPPGLTLERRNNNKGYSPANCRWATSTEQNRNTRTNRKLTANGKTQLLVDWARELGCRPAVVWLRLERRGWSVQDACTIPVRAKKSNVVLLTANGKTQTTAEWARELGCSSVIISTRINRLGWSAQDACTTPVYRSRRQVMP